MKSSFFALIPVLAASTLSLSAHAAPVLVNAAGATFPYPIYARWAYDFGKSSDVKINYQSIGSGGGIAQIKARTVDFGATDAPLSKEELEKEGLVQFPTVMGGIVPVVNLPGIKAGELKLSEENLAKIYLGTLKKWNDPALVKDNPTLKLPDRDITPVYRSDSSGTTWIFTNYLSKVSADWKSKVGNDKTVPWPLGLGGKGNEGVAATVMRVAGGIGYVESAYATQSKMTFTSLQNADGVFVAPSLESFRAAAENTDWTSAPGFGVVLTRAPGKNTWPIVGATFILVHKDQTPKNASAAKASKERAEAVLKFFDWAYTSGSKAATDLQYVSLPDSVTKLVRDEWSQKITLGSEKVWPVKR